MKNNSSIELTFIEIILIIHYSMLVIWLKNTSTGKKKKN